MVSDGARPRGPRPRRRSRARLADAGRAARLAAYAARDAVADLGRWLRARAKAFGRWCATEEVATAAALRALHRPRVPHKLVEPLDDAALRRMLDAASVRDRAIVLLMLDTGLRLSELAGLRPSDLRPDGSLKVMGKGARERIVPVGGVARQELVRYLRQANVAGAGAAIFRGRGGGALGARGVQQVFKRLKTRAAISGRCSPHTLRHTFARAYLLNGGDAFSLQRMLGHSTLDMVKRYVALADTDLALDMRSLRPPTVSSPPPPEPPNRGSGARGNPERRACPAAPVRR